MSKTMSSNNKLQKRQRQFNSYFTLAVTFLFTCSIGFLITSGSKDEKSIDHRFFYNNLWFMLFLLVSLMSIVIIFLFNKSQHLNKFRSK